MCARRLLRLYLGHHGEPALAPDRANDQHEGRAEEQLYVLEVLAEAQRFVVRVELREDDAGGVVELSCTPFDFLTEIHVRQRHQLQPRHLKLERICIVGN